MADVMKFDDFKAEGSENAVKVSVLHFVLGSFHANVMDSAIG